MLPHLNPKGISKEDIQEYMEYILNVLWNEKTGLLYSKAQEINDRSLSQF